jgi:hypothetical protein
MWRQRSAEMQGPARVVRYRGNRMMFTNVGSSSTYEQNCRRLRCRGAHRSSATSFIETRMNIFVGAKTACEHFCQRPNPQSLIPNH